MKFHETRLEFKSKQNEHIHRLDEVNLQLSILFLGGLHPRPPPLPVFRGECFKDSKHRLLPHHKDFKHTNSIRTCHNYCRNSGFLFMGLQYWHQCFCGNDPPPRSKLAAPSSCKLPCKGDRSEICGGHWRLSVYSTQVAPGTRII